MKYLENKFQTESQDIEHFTSEDLMSPFRNIQRYLSVTMLGSLDVQKLKMKKN